LHSRFAPVGARLYARPHFCIFVFHENGFCGLPVKIQKVLLFVSPDSHLVILSVNPRPKSSKLANFKDSPSSKSPHFKDFV